MSSIDTEPMMGNFIPMSSAEGLFLVPPSHPRSPRRLRSRSPRHRRKEPGVHLHLSLTDSQMDKLTSTITKEDGSRPKTHRRSGTTDGCDLAMASMQHHQSVMDELPPPPPTISVPALPPRGKVASPASASSEEQNLDRPYVHHTRGRSHNDNYKDTYGYASTAPFSPPAHSDIRASSPGKNSHVQESISTPATSIHAAMESNMGRKSTESGPSVHYHSEGSGRLPLPPRNRQQVFEEPGMTDASSSTYSMDELIKAIPHIHPLYVKRIAEMTSPNRSPGLSPEHPPSPLQEYTAWAAVSPMSVSEQFGGRNGDVDSQVSPGIHAGEKTEQPQHPVAGVKSNGDYADPVVHPHAQTDQAGDAPHEMYSPLTSLSNEPQFATVRRGHKVMVGHNGWLERPGSVDKKPDPPKKAGFFDTLKRVAKEVVDAADMKSPRRTKDNDRGRRASARMRISLNPREQSLLYCELEFLLTSALDGYINSQFNAGRLDADKYKKIVDAWHQKGRPKVVGFRYDLETQLDLVFLHVQEFRFYGNRAGVPAAISGILEAMRVNARALRVRTFCQPDSAMAKQLLDSQSLLNLLGSAEQRQIQLAEVVQFFKIVLEREHSLHNSEEGRGVHRSPTAKTLPRASESHDGAHEAHATTRGR